MVRLGTSRKTLASTTIFSYLAEYEVLSGMTGTPHEEFFKEFGTDTVLSLSVYDVAPNRFRALEPAAGTEEGCVFYEHSFRTFMTAV